MRRWFLLALTAALVTTAVVAAVAVAGGTGGPSGWVDRGVQALGGAAGGDSRQVGAEDAWRYCGEGAFRAGPAFEAVQDPQARGEAEKLREQHRAEMREWWGRYGDDPRSDEAQKALQALREQHRGQFRALFERHGIDVPEGRRLGEGGRARGMFGAGEGGVCGQGRGGKIGGTDSTPSGL